MIGYIIDSRTHEVLYVTDIPGHGGKDWEYGNKKYAIDLSEYWQRRFRRDMERFGRKVYFVEKRYIKNPQHRMRYVNIDDDIEELENEEPDEEEPDEEESNVVVRGDKFVVNNNFSIMVHEIPGHRSICNVSGTIEMKEGDHLVFNGTSSNKYHEFLYYPKFSKNRAAEFCFFVLNPDIIFENVYRV